MSTVLELSKDFDGFNVLRREESVILESGQLLQVEGDYTGGVALFLDHLSGNIVSTPGTQVLDGFDVSSESPDILHRLGLRYVSGRRKLMGSLTVEEHLRLRTRLKGRKLKAALCQLIRCVSILENLCDIPVGNLSGGQQQLAMLALGAIGNPTVLVVDEPYMGVAPDMQNSIEEMFSDVLSKGSALIIAEQTSSNRIEADCLIDFRKQV